MSSSSAIAMKGKMFKKSGWVGAWRERYFELKGSILTFSEEIDIAPHGQYDLNLLTNVSANMVTQIPKFKNDEWTTSDICLTIGREKVILVCPGTSVRQWRDRFQEVIDRRSSIPVTANTSPMVTSVPTSGMKATTEPVASSSNTVFKAPPATVIPRRPVSPSIPTGKVFKSLSDAIKTGNTADVKKMIEEGADVNVKDSDGLPLYVAAANHKVGAVKVLLAAGARPNDVYYGGTPLIAGLNRSGLPREMIVDLIAGGADVNLGDREGKTPLMWTTYQEFEDLIPIFLNAGADISAVNNNDDNIFHLLMNMANNRYSSWRKFMPLVLPAGVDHTAMNKDGKRPIDLVTDGALRAEIEGMIRAANVPIKKCVQPRPVRAFTSLHECIKEGSVMELQSMIKSGRYDINAKIDNNTALHAAISKPRYSAVKILLDAGADPNIVDRNNKTPLVSALMSSSCPDHVVSDLMAARTDINITDNEGKTALMWTLHQMFLKHAEEFIKAGADITVTDKRGNNVAHLLLKSASSSYKRYKEFLPVFLAAGVDTNALNYDGQRPSEMINDSAVRTEVEAMIAASKVPIKKSLKTAPVKVFNSLNECIKDGSIMDLSAMVATGKYDVNAKLDQTTPLHAAINVGRYPAVKILLNAGADPNLLDRYNKTPLISVLQSSACPDHVVSDLLAAGTDINAVDNDGKTALLMTPHQMFLKHAQTLIKAGADISAADKRGNNTLHLVLKSASSTYSKYKEFLPVLLAAGIDTTALNYDGKRPVDVIVEESVRSEVAAIIAASKVPIKKALSAPPIKTHASLHDAVMNGSVMELKQMLDSGKFDINGKINEKTPLHVASTYSRDSAFRMLLDHGARVDEKDGNGTTPLLELILRPGHTEMIKHILTKGASLEMTDRDGKNALLWTTHQGYVNLVPIFLQAGANINATDKDGSNLLHLVLKQASASYDKWTEFTPLLLNAGIDVNAVNKKGQKPLDLVVDERVREEVGKVLSTPVRKSAPVVAAVIKTPINDSKSTMSSDIKPQAANVVEVREETITQSPDTAELNVKEIDEDAKEPKAVLSEKVSSIKADKSSSESSDLPSPAVDKLIESQLQSLLKVQPQLLMMSQSVQSNSLVTLSPSTVEYLQRQGNAGVIAEQQFNIIKDDPLLFEYYVAFTQAVTSAVLALQTISSGMVANTKKSLTEKCSEFISFDKAADWLHTAGTASGVPFVSIATSVCKYLIQLPYDIARTQAMYRVTTAFPSVESHKFIEIMSREMTMLLRDEIKDYCGSEFKKAKKLWEWLHTYQNATPAATFAATHASLLLGMLMKNDPPFTVQMHNIEEMMTWALGANRIGDFTVSELLKRLRSGVQKPIIEQIVTEPTTVVTESSVNVVAAASVTATAPVVKMTESSALDDMALLKAELAAMREQYRLQAESFAQQAQKLAQQESESLKNKKKLDTMEKQLKQLNVLNEVFGGADQLQSQNTMSVHEKLDKHLAQTAEALVAVDLLVNDMRMVKETVGLDAVPVDAGSDSVHQQNKEELLKR